MERTGIARKLFQGDVAIWIIFMLLCCISIIEVFSATSTLAFKHANIWMPIARHASYLFVGFLFTLGLSHTPHTYFSLGILLLPVSILLLIATIFWGISDNEATRRLDLFGTPFQPSEFGKLACIIFVAFLLSKREKISNEKTFKYIWIGVGAVCLLIFPSNLSTTLILGVVCFLMMFIGQIPFTKLLRLLFFVSVAALVFVLLLCVIPPDTTRKYMPRAVTWQKRVHTFVGYNTDTIEKQRTDDTYQITISQIAIARGGVFGKLPGQSIQRDILPRAFDDFIYAIIIEEMGVVGGIFVLMLYVMLMIRVSVIARRCEKLFPKFLVLGSGLLIVIQALVHMAVTVNLFPVTGQPLPLISRGGTSIVTTCILIGMILSVSRFSAKMNEGEEQNEEGDGNENEENANNEPEKDGYSEENLNLAAEIEEVET